MQAVFDPSRGGGPVGKRSSKRRRPEVGWHLHPCIDIESTFLVKGIHKIRPPRVGMQAISHGVFRGGPIDQATTTDVPAGLRFMPCSPPPQIDSGEPRVRPFRGKAQGHRIREQVVEVRRKKVRGDRGDSPRDDPRNPTRFDHFGIAKQGKVFGNLIGEVDQATSLFQACAT